MEYSKASKSIRGFAGNQPDHKWSAPSRHYSHYPFPRKSNGNRQHAYKYLWRYQGHDQRYLHQVCKGLIGVLLVHMINVCKKINQPRSSLDVQRCQTETVRTQYLAYAKTFIQCWVRWRRWSLWLQPPQVPFHGCRSFVYTRKHCVQYGRVCWSSRNAHFIYPVSEEDWCSAKHNPG